MKKSILMMLLLAASMVCAQANEPLDVKYGPWVTAVGEDTFTVLWVTETPGQAWVELPDGSRFYHEFAGRRIFERLHTVKVTGLDAGTKYSYKIGCKPLKDDTDARDPEFYEEEESGGYSIKTFDHSSRECHFAVFNDIHCNLARYNSFVACTDPETTDFLFLNGDIASADNYVLDSLAHYDFDALKGFADKVPVLFARGNHEGRGNNPKLVSELFPSSTGQFYYAFREGPAAFVVFDAGETHEDRSSAYCGTPEYDSYIFQQMEWFKGIASQPWFADAPQRICLLHVPMVDIGEEFTLQLWLNKHCIDILNEAGIDMMISADLHEFQFHEAGTMNNNFPIYVNDDDFRAEVTCRDDRLLLRVFDREGQELYVWGDIDY